MSHVGQNSGSMCTPYCGVPSKCHYGGVIETRGDIVTHQIACQCTHVSCTELVLWIGPESLQITHGYVKSEYFSDFYNNARAQNIIGWRIDSLVPGICNLNSVIFKLISRMNILGILCVTTLRWTGPDWWTRPHWCLEDVNLCLSHSLTYMCGTRGRWVNELYLETLYFSLMVFYNSTASNQPQYNTLIIAIVSDHIAHKMWDEIIYIFPNFTASPWMDDIWNGACVTMNNDFWSFCIDKSHHKWPKIVIHDNECIILFISYMLFYVLSTQFHIKKKQSSIAHFTIVAKDGFFWHCDVPAVDLWSHANAKYWHCDVIILDYSCTRK